VFWIQVPYIAEEVCGSTIVSDETRIVEYVFSFVELPRPVTSSDQCLSWQSQQGGIHGILSLEVQWNPHTYCLEHTRCHWNASLFSNTV
jgi:hypothetical protein